MYVQPFHSKRDISMYFVTNIFSVVWLSYPISFSNGSSFNDDLTRYRSLRCGASAIVVIFDLTMTIIGLWPCRSQLVESWYVLVGLCISTATFRVIYRGAGWRKGEKNTLCLFCRDIFLLDKNFGLLPRTGNREKEEKKMGEAGKKNDKSRGTVKISGENSWRDAMLRRRNFCKRFPTTMQPRSFYFCWNFHAWFPEHGDLWRLKPTDRTFVWIKLFFPFALHQCEFEELELAIFRSNKAICSILLFPASTQSFVCQSWNFIIHYEILEEDYVFSNEIHSFMLKYIDKCTRW